MAALYQTELPNVCQNIPFFFKRERSGYAPFPCTVDAEPISVVPNKKSRHDDPNSSNANGSEDSTTTTHDLCTTNTSSALVEIPLLESLDPKENHSNKLTAFDSVNLEKSVPPGYLKFINNLENEILNASMERETLKIEVMRAQAMINVLQSRIELLNKENEDLKRDG